MKDVRSPEDMEPLIVKLAPYITTTITESVDAALRPPEKSPTTFCITKQIRLNAEGRKQVYAVAHRTKYKWLTHSLLKSKIECLLNFLRVACYFIIFLGKRSYCSYSTKGFLSNTHKINIRLNIFSHDVGLMEEAYLSN